MTSVAERVIREPSVDSAQQYAQRIRRLSWAYVGVFLGSCVGIGLIVWQAQFFVSLSERSNVETLILAFFLIFFGYLVFLTASGVWGVGHILYFAVLHAVRPDQDEVRRLKMRALGPPQGHVATVALNVALALDARPGQRFTIPVEDAAGSMGEIAVDGAQVSHNAVHRDGSNTLLAYVVQQANQVLAARGAQADLNIVEWKRINDESTDEYLSLVRFARNLEKRLDVEELWPTRIITQADCEELRCRLCAVCDPLRNEDFLPHWEYQGVHQLPLIPDPLGLIKLQRNEKRVDPVASMGCAALIVIAVVVVLVLFIVFPPWVPGM